ncbi:hypothetical protein BGW38_002876, partial [Lunasporangiospora selenospora]
MPSPFDIPEILERIARFVSAEDALSCMLVSKAFTQAFAYPVWYQVDFNIHKKFTKTNPTALTKYGHHTQIIKNLGDINQLHSLLYFDSPKLQNLSLSLITDPEYLASCNDLIRWSKPTLTELQMQHPDGSTRKSQPLVTLDSLGSTAYSSQPSVLVSLSLRWLKMPRESFNVVLRSCPALKQVDMWGTTFLAARNFIDFKHTGVLKFQAIITDIFTNNNSNNPSPLIHFPNLICWITGSDGNIQSFPTQAVKTAVAKWCPKLKTLGSSFTSAQLLPHLIKDVFVTLSSLILAYSNVTQDLILAIIRVQSRWRTLKAYVPRDGYYSEFKNKGMASINDPLPNLGWVFQSLPRLCRNLEHFQFPEHVMNMDEVEIEPWGCKNLQTLYIRFQELDSRDAIEGAIEQWIKRRESNTTDDDKSEETKSWETKLGETESEEAESEDTQSGEEDLGIEER